ncbi:MAG: DUF4956 domain-containing protein [Gemmatimonadetes bacterium]|nr:DUF4956 domain-containing protein [Gemmatimonadota bacterium]
MAGNWPKAGLESPKDGRKEPKASGPPEEETRRKWKPRALGRLTGYFVLALALAFIAVKVGLDGTVENATRWAGGGGKSELLTESIPATNSVRAALHDLWVAIVTAVIFAIPISLTYALTKRREGYDRSIVQMLIILPVVVSAVILVVQGSLALAFTLAGIVAVVRFRATFRDVRDAVFGFAAIAVGLAAGMHSIVIAAGLSLAFCTLAIALWELNVGDIRADLGRIEGKVPLAEALVPVGSEDSFVRGQVETTMPNGKVPELAEEAARLERIIQTDAELHKKKSRYTHLLLVHTSKAQPTREAVEELLDSSTKRWRFVSEVPYQNGTRTLEFLARLRQGANESKLLSEIQQKGRDVVGVELKAVGALREAMT